LRPGPARALILLWSTAGGLRRRRRHAGHALRGGHGIVFVLSVTIDMFRSRPRGNREDFVQTPIAWATFILEPPRCSGERDSKLRPSGGEVNRHAGASAWPSRRPTRPPDPGRGSGFPGP